MNQLKFTAATMTLAVLLSSSTVHSSAIPNLRSLQQQFVPEAITSNMNCFLTKGKLTPIAYGASINRGGYVGDKVGVFRMYMNGEKRVLSQNQQYVDNDVHAVGFLPPTQAAGDWLSNNKEYKCNQTTDQFPQEASGPSVACFRGENTTPMFSGARLVPGKGDEKFFRIGRPAPTGGDAFFGKAVGDVEHWTTIGGAGGFNFDGSAYKLKAEDPKNSVTCRTI